jgi:predicted phosphodiesterase
VDGNPELSLKWPVIQPGPVVNIPRNRTKPTKRDLKRCVVLPDAQIGYYRDRKGKLRPTHDETAIAIALSIVRKANPEIVALVGDNLDLPELSKYRVTPAYQQTTQASIDRAAIFCAELRDAAPNAQIVWLAGNHEERLPNHILDNARAAYGLRRGNIPDNWPVMSVPYLCRMEDFGIEYRPGYPANHLWLNQRIRIVHGDRVKSSGSTAHLYLSNEKTSVIYGHIHRIELAYKTNCKHWIGLGSQAEYGNQNKILAEDAITIPTTLYGKAKLSSGITALGMCDAYNPSIIIIMKNYVIENKKNGDKLYSAPQLQ